MNTNTTPQTSEEVASQLQGLIIDHLKEVYIRHSSSSVRAILAEYDLRRTMELVCDQLPLALQPAIKEILTLCSLLNGVAVDRYYVQRLSDTYFVVWEHQEDRYQPSPEDRLVRADFSRHEDARAYERAMNELQRTLDLEYGRWTKHAV